MRWEWCLRGSSMAAMVVWGGLEVVQVGIRMRSLHSEWKRLNKGLLKLAMVELAESCDLIETLKKKP